MQLLWNALKLKSKQNVEYGSIQGKSKSDKKNVLI